MRLNLLAAAGITVLVFGLIADVEANFAAVDGFSGRNGPTCLACHTEAPMTTPATIHLDGLPEAWTAAASAELTIRIEGGPVARPAPQPQGGFELAVSHGTLAPGPTMDGLLRNSGPDSITYTPEGTLRRTWQVTWQAPELAELDAPPGPVTFWLSGIAADGGHLVAAGLPDQAERFDAVSSLVASVPPSDTLAAAWLDTPLLLPTTRIEVATATTIRGHHEDPLADAVAWRIDGGDWTRRTTGPDWRLELALPSGGHTIDVRSEGAGRASDAVRFDVELDAAQPGAVDAPSLGVAGGLLALGAFVAVASRRRP